MMNVFDFLDLVVVCVLSFFVLCRVFDVDKLTSDQLAQYNKELKYQRWWFECNAVPSNHQCEKMAEQAVIEGKTQDDNPFPYGTRDYDRWLCSYMEFKAKKQFKYYSEYPLGTKAHAYGGGAAGSRSNVAGSGQQVGAYFPHLERRSYELNYRMRKNMNKLFLVIICQIPPIILAIGATYMGSNEISGWGWFILGSVLTSASITFGKES